MRCYKRSHSSNLRLLKSITNQHSNLNSSNKHVLNILISWEKSLIESEKEFKKGCSFLKRREINSSHPKSKSKCYSNNSTPSIFKISMVPQDHWERIFSSIPSKLSMNSSLNIWEMTLSLMRSLASFIARLTKKTSNKLISHWLKCIKPVKSNWYHSPERTVPNTSPKSDK